MRKTKLLTLFVLLTVAMGAMAQAGFYAGIAAYEGNNAPSTAWKVGDKLYVYGVSSTTHDQVLMGELEATEAGVKSFMAGTLSFAETGTDVPMTLTLSNLPLPLDYTGTDGSLANARSYATTTAIATAIDATAGTVTLDATPELKLRQALVKVTLLDTEGGDLIPSSLKSDLRNVNYNYSTINLLHHDMPVEGAGDWIFGGATFENGTITLPKEGGGGCGWKPEFWSEDLTKYTGIIAVFDEPLNQDCIFCVAYTMEGDAQQYYYTNKIYQGAGYAYVDVPYWNSPSKINGIYFYSDGSSEDVRIKPVDFWLNYPDAYKFPLTWATTPISSNVFYLPLNGMETDSRLSFDAKVGNKNYVFSADDITYEEGTFYEQTYKLDNVVRLYLNPTPNRIDVTVDGVNKTQDYWNNYYLKVKPNANVKITPRYGFKLKKIEVEEVKWM